MKKKTQATKAVILTSTNTAHKAMILINIKVKMKVKQEEIKIEDSDIMSLLLELNISLKATKSQLKSPIDITHTKSMSGLKFNHLILFNSKIKPSKTLTVTLPIKMLTFNQNNQKN
jgi:hypothetical protein